MNHLAYRRRVPFVVHSVACFHGLSNLQNICRSGIDGELVGATLLKCSGMKMWILISKAGATLADNGMMRAVKTICHVTTESNALIVTSGICRKTMETTFTMRTMWIH